MKLTSYNKGTGVLKKGDIICYRSHLGKVKKVTPEGVTIQGPYIEQTIDWDDVKEYNKDLFQ